MSSSVTDIGNIVGNNPRAYYNPASIAWELTKGNAVNRSFMNACIRSFVSLKGKVLDIGSGKSPRYLSIINKCKDVDYIRADGDSNNSPDIVMDIEKRFPIKDKCFDRILLFNVLEHIYDYKKSIAEIERILKDDGIFYLYVPFFIKIHGSPLDFHRYTHFTLNRMLNDVGFSNVKIYTSGGFFKVLSELFNWLSRLGIGYVLYPVYFILSILDDLIGKITKDAYLINYPTGYFVICRKS